MIGPSHAADAARVKPATKSRDCARPRRKLESALRPYCTLRGPLAELQPRDKELARHVATQAAPPRQTTDELHQMRRAQTHPECASCGADVQRRNGATLRPAGRFFGMRFRAHQEGLRQSPLAKPSQGEQGFFGSHSESVKWLVVGRHSVRPSIGHRPAKRPVASLPSMRTCLHPRCMATSAQPSAPLPLSTIAGPAATQAQTSDQQQQQQRNSSSKSSSAPTVPQNRLSSTAPRLLRFTWQRPTSFVHPTPKLCFHFLPSPTPSSVVLRPTSALSPCSCSPGSSASLVNLSNWPT